MSGRKAMDVDITCWILEFLLRQPIPDLLANKLISNADVPISDDNPRLKKTLVLRSIEAEVADGAVSEAILESLEIIEELDCKEKIPIADSMKQAYCAVAVECTVKYLGGTPSKRGQGRYFEAVERVWRGRIGNLEKNKSELVNEEVRKFRDEIESAIWDSNASKRLLEMNTRNDALVLVRDYLGEAMALMGPPFLELVARNEREMKEKERAVGIVEGVAEKPAINEVTKKNAVHRYKHVASNRLRRKGGQARITDSEENFDLPSCRYDTLPTPEVNKVQEALKSSSLELQAVVKDPLPDALNLAETVIVEMARKILIQETSVANQNGKNVDASSPPVGALFSEMAMKIFNRELLAENHNGKDVDAPDLPANHPVEPGQIDDSNAGIPSCSHQNNVPKPSLMERNSTARTYEWDDSLDGSAEETTCGRKRFRLDSPRREPVSPLKKYELTKFAKRRKMKRWSLEEEDALREGVQKFGKGNWKLILNSKRDIFAERTEVDLKDKWRNMTRY